MISGPLSSLPPHLESRLNLGRAKPEQGGGEKPGQASPRQRPSDIMVAAVTARTSGAKTPGQQGSSGNTVVTRPTSAVKPVNITSKVDSGLSRAGPGRVPVVRQQRSHSAGPARKNSLQHRQVETLRASTAAPSKVATPELSRKQQQVASSLADDEASDTENEMREVQLVVVLSLDLFIN